MAAALPAAGSPRPVPSAARGAHALLRLASPGPRAASPMPFSGEERSLQGIYKPAAPAEGRATGGATVCTECYTNRSFVYDDGSARRYPPAGGGGGSGPGGRGAGGRWPGAACVAAEPPRAEGSSPFHRRRDPAGGAGLGPAGPSPRVPTALPVARAWKKSFRDTSRPGLGSPANAPAGSIAWGMG